MYFDFPQHEGDKVDDGNIKFLMSYLEYSPCPEVRLTTNQGQGPDVVTDHVANKHLVERNHESHYRVR